MKRVCWGQVGSDCGHWAGADGEEEEVGEMGR